MIASLPPGAPLILGALLVPVLPRRLMQAWLLLVPLLSLWHLLSLPMDSVTSLDLYGMTLHPVRVDRLAMVWGYVFHGAAFLSLLFALHVEDRVQHVAGMTYAGSAIAAAFAGDLVTLFVWWELTAITSVFLVWASRTDKAQAVGLRYLIIQVGSGVLLLSGVILRVSAGGGVDFGHIGLEGAGGTLIFLAFGIKAAFPLLHNWLQDSYPASTATGTVFLSAFTTKLAIYALARGFAGTEVLILIGAAMTAFPIFYAVIENDLRRVLAYSLNNQLGFMVVGVGIGTELALNGTASHAFSHILYKGLLFMSMGAVLHRTGTVKASELMKLGGLYKVMPLTTFFCLIGAASISAFPLFSGFVSKSMIVSAVAEHHHTGVYLVLVFASAGVLHHSGIKIPFAAFFHQAPDAPERPPESIREAPVHMLIAMGLTAAACVGIGVHPQWLYSILPYEVDYAPYTTAHVVTQMQLLIGALFAFGLMARLHLEAPELPSTNLDFDWVYRKLLPRVVGEIGGFVGEMTRAVRKVMFDGVDRAIGRAYRLHGPEGVLARTWSTNATSASVMLFLVFYLMMYFTAA